MRLRAGSTRLQRRHDPRQRQGFDIGANHDPLACHGHDLHAPDSCSRTQRRLLVKHDQGRCKADHLVATATVLSKRFAPGEQQRGRDIVATSRRRYLSVTLETLPHDPELLRQAPATTATGVYHRQTLNLETILITGHKVSFADPHSLWQAVLTGGLACASSRSAAASWRTTIPESPRS